MRQKAKEEIAETLRKHIGDIDTQLWRNKRDMKNLTERQTVLKRKKAEITKIINELVPHNKETPT